MGRGSTHGCQNPDSYILGWYQPCRQQPSFSDFRSDEQHVEVTARLEGLRTHERDEGTSLHRVLSASAP
jgi:hypothetical protein